MAGGGEGGSIETRLERDVLAHRPTVVTIMLGMNDGRFRAFDQGIFDTYKNGLETIVQKLERRKPGVRITLIRPSPYDDVTRQPRFAGGYNAVLVRFGEAAEEIAKAHGQQVADLNAPMVEMLKRAKAEDAKRAEKLIGDRVHPGSSGQLPMAAALLKAWGAPAVVSAVEIDVAQRKVARAENTAVTDFQAEERGYSWTQKDRALPMGLEPGNKEMALVVRSSDFMQDLNQQTLRVRGGTSAYELRIDGVVVGAFSPAEMAEGINLAQLNTPMVRQARAVQELTKRRAEVCNFRLKNLQLPLQAMSGLPVDRVTESLRSLDATADVLRQAQRTMARPKTHRYELRAISSAPRKMSGNAEASGLSVAAEQNSLLAASQ